MSAEQSLRQKIEAKIASYRIAITELSDLLKDQPGSAPTPRSGSKTAATSIKAAEEPTTGRGRSRKRRKAGWMAANVDKVLAETPGLTVGEIAERITSMTGQSVKSGLVNVFVSKSGGKYAKDTSGGPRRTRWSLAAGAAASAPEAPAAEAPAKAKKSRKKG